MDRSRVGAFAANVGNIGRVPSGGSYYGIMELSGNVNERAITIGASQRPRLYRHPRKW
ncbi:MAG: hypothetical protein IPG69_18790 [Flavobacteriales bacterium]|nr:hypothetical protein [Flavobacteriales bacterium]